MLFEGRVTPLCRLALRGIVATSLSLIVAILGCFPANWIEMRFGLNPDGGNGAMEFLLVLLPLALVALLCLSGKRHRSPQSRNGKAPSSINGSCASPKINIGRYRSNDLVL